MAEVVWATRGWDALLERWTNEDKPDPVLVAVVIHWLMDLRRHPFPAEAAPIPGPVAHLWIADIPDTHTVSFLYSVNAAEHELSGWLLETL